MRVTSTFLVAFACFLLQSDAQFSDSGKYKNEIRGLFTIRSDSFNLKSGIEFEYSSGYTVSRLWGDL